ncbi:MAG: hypothetical protein ACRDGA_01505 [Bacteroidota bacterium]
MKLTRNEIVLLTDHVMQDIRRREKGTFVTRKDAKFSVRDAKLAEKAVTKLMMAIHGCGADVGIELPQNWIFELQSEFPRRRLHL